MFVDLFLDLSGVDLWNLLGSKVANMSSQINMSIDSGKIYFLRRSSAPKGSWLVPGGV